MVEISSFKQAFQLYKSNQIALPVVQDIAYTLMSACDDIPPNVHSSTDINTDNLKWLSGQLSAEFSFNEYLGGNAHICESEPDLTNIKAFDQDWADAHGDWPNVTDQPMVWDICHQLNEGYVAFCYIWNNAGGPVYYVPSYLWEIARVSEHLLINNG